MLKPNVRMNIPMAPNALLFASSSLSIPLSKNGCLESNTPTYKVNRIPVNEYMAQQRDPWPRSLHILIDWFVFASFLNERSEVIMQMSDWSCQVI
mmetsp:Transcript_17720/g.27567  ORF Transcript_17720/g.27567 Transcript_17720/m.27567 type:complete len:95 (+) Transcript_17720:313-597(+)